MVVVVVRFVVIRVAFWLWLEELVVGVEGRESFDVSGLDRRCRCFVFDRAAALDCDHGRVGAADRERGTDPDEHALDGVVAV
jgi:hypothetical protein